MAQRRLIYWLLERVTPRHRELMMHLEARGHTVQVLTSLNYLLTALQTRRSGIVVIEDDAEQKHVEKAILTITNLPELQGARFVLSLQKHDTSLLQLAAWLNFRDCLPLDLPFEQWITRFLFAINSQPTPFKQPLPQISTGSIAAITLPARLVWVNAKRMRFEARLNPPIGANLTIAGHLADTLGIRGLTITVEEVHNKRLVHRFSNAIVASWSIPESARAQAEIVLDRLRQADRGPKSRVFLAVATSSLRAELLSSLDDTRFELKAALQKQGIVNEPKFFGPDVVIIESSLCVENGGERFVQMLDSMEPHIPIIVIGQNTLRETIKALAPERPIRFLNRVPPQFSEFVLTECLSVSSEPSPGTPSQAIHLAAEDSFSYATVSFPVRLAQAHPTAGRINLPFQIGNFGIYRLDAPFLRQIIGRYPYIKLTDTYVNPRVHTSSFSFTAEFYICNVDQEAREKLANGLAEYISDALRMQTSQTTKAQQSHSLDSQDDRIHITSVQNIIREEPTVAPDGSYLLPTGTDGETLPVAVPKMEPALVMAPKEVAAAKPSATPEAVVLSDLISKSRRGAFEKLRGLWTPSLKYFLLFVAFTTFAILVLWGVANRIAPQYEKSGGQYSDALRKFAPKKWNESSGESP